MKTFFAFLIVILLFNSYICYSNDTTAIKYYPLKIGNSWTYHFTASGYGGYYTSFDYKISIVDTVRINSNYYFKCKYSYDTAVSFYRIDSISGILSNYVYSGCFNSRHEVNIDSLNSSLGNYYTPNCSTDGIHCIDTSIQNIFNIAARSKKFEHLTSATINRRYCYGIGLVSESFVFTGGHYYSESITLKGCRINNITFGDTSIASIYLINSQIPVFLSLSQNYPNPFNPQTKIKFDIPANVKSETSNLSKLPLRKASVKLVIYDLLGREVTTLVNQELKPGTYETEWDGSNYSSGIYFYKLVAGDFTETKKMVLMK